MKFELMTTLTVNGERKAPITVFINQNELDINHRIDVVAKCYKERTKFDEASKEHKAGIDKLINELRASLQGGARVIPATLISMDGLSLEYKVYQSTFKEESW